MGHRPRLLGMRLGTSSRVFRSQRLWMQLALPSTKRTVRTLVGGKVV